MSPLPSGTVTFLFTDIEGSTKLWEQHPEAMRVALARHDDLLRRAIEENHGYVFKTVGDAFCAAFATAPDALNAAVQSHLLLLNEQWGETGSLRVRVGLHTGQAEERDGDYFGQTLNRVARLQGVGHGQQTLLSQATYQSVCSSLPADVTLQDMGQHRLKDLLAPEHVWQVFHPALPSEFPPLKSLDYLPTNLPRQVTSFIGREREIAEVKQLLPHTPLLTLLGTGGAGKTRLALQVGADLLDNYKDGVWLVEFAALSDPDFVPQTVANALGLREEAGRPLLLTIQDYLRDRQLLLILDNCEHLLHACATLADALLKTCSYLTILATSRERLGITGERSWRVPSLLTPAPNNMPMEEKDIAAVLMEYDACHLFVERAVVQRQDFVLTRSNVPVVAHLCQQLDGIPLAIELAAARVRSLSVEEINSKLDNRFRILTGGSRTALPRQQTLRALVDWSYNLLNLQEQSLLCRISVFAGGWTLEAAEAIGAGEDVEVQDVFDLLTSLVDKSLVVVDQEEEHTRYRLLETIRQYGMERLMEVGKGKCVFEKHQMFFVNVAESAEPHLWGLEVLLWLNRLDREHDNLRAALEWDNAEVTLRIAGALLRFWCMRGYYAEGRKCLMDALANPATISCTSARAKALNAVGVLARNQGDHAVAQKLHEQGLALYQELGDKCGMASSFLNLGNVYDAQRNYTLVRTSLEKSLILFQELKDRHGIAAVMLSLGRDAFRQGNYSEAHDLYKQGFVLFHSLGDKFNTCLALLNFAALAAVQEQGACAARIWGAAEALGEKLGFSIHPFDYLYDGLDAKERNALGNDAFDAAWAEGRAMTMEQAIRYALNEEA